MANILVVEDDEEICEILQFYLLEKEEYQVTITHSAEKALPLIRMRRFDLALLDVQLPGIDGIDFCRELRKVSYCPVIFISCINDDETIIRALNTGGDDYLVKPFRAPVLLARIEANLRRASLTHSEIATLCAGDLELDTGSRSVRKRGETLNLSPIEYEILYYLMKNEGRFVTFDEVYQAVWQRPSLGDMRALFVHVSHLRQKIEDNPSKPAYIRTHMRDGYLFTKPAAEQ
ncbi:MAG: response regulator transcription factor [Lachnospiraceae bacterium]|nr:response regulator transcription factor [Lachnospiraceae bacterium]